MSWWLHLSTPLIQWDGKWWWWCLTKVCDRDILEIRGLGKLPGNSVAGECRARGISTAAYYKRLKKLGGVNSEVDKGCLSQSLQITIVKLDTLVNRWIESLESIRQQKDLSQKELINLTTNLIKAASSYRAALKSGAGGLNINIDQREQTVNIDTINSDQLYGRLFGS